MPDAKWLKEYSGQTAEQLLSLEGEFRVDSLLVAFEQALDQKTARDGEQSLSTQEHTILAVEALEREVNNGGYGQFFLNSSRRYAPGIVDSLKRIGCLKTAEITQKAVAALKLQNLSAETTETTMAVESDERGEELARCDDLYYNAGENISDALFAFIRANKDAINL